MSTGLTGDYQMGVYVFEPSSKVFVVWEREGDWTDTLGTLHNERDFSAGRVRLAARSFIRGTWVACALRRISGRTAIIAS
jgi:hypothetical protein